MKSVEEKSLTNKLILGAVVVATGALYFFVQGNNTNNLVINEIAFSQSDKADWVEIYNPTLNNLSLKGLYVTDSAKDFSKYQIEDDVVVPANGFIVLYADGYEGDVENSVVTNFRISNGETVYLIAQNGQAIIDSLSAIVNTDEENVTVGRYPDGSNDIFQMTENTPGTANIK